MFKITLPADRAVVDMVAVAEAFGINVKGLDDAIHIGTVSRWFELGEGDQDNKPHWIFASTRLGLTVDVDEHGFVHSVNEYRTVSAELQQKTGQYGNAVRSKTLLAKAVDPNIEDADDIARRARLDALLDEALEESFPASDPIAISFYSPHRTARL